MPESLKLTCFSIFRESNAGDLTTVLEGLAHSILVDVEGEISNEYGEASWILLGGGTRARDGLGGGVLDVEPTASEVSAVVLEGSCCTSRILELDNGCLGVHVWSVVRG